LHKVLANKTLRKVKQRFLSNILKIITTLSLLDLCLFVLFCLFLVTHYCWIVFPESQWCPSLITEWKAVSPSLLADELKIWSLSALDAAIKSSTQEMFGFRPFRVLNLILIENRETVQLASRLFARFLDLLLSIHRIRFQLSPTTSSQMFFPPTALSIQWLASNEIRNVCRPASTVVL
jgi:hypothetical protein